MTIKITITHDEPTNDRLVRVRTVQTFPDKPSEYRDCFLSPGTTVSVLVIEVSEARKEELPTCSAAITKAESK